jgi:hypothetical protein
MTTQTTNIRAIENAHILLWLLKDASWVHEWRWVGCAVIAPTILVQIFITWNNRKDWGELLHNAAIVFWLAANSIWMIGEFFYNDGTRSAASWFFDIGFILIGTYYVSMLYRKVCHV